MTHNGHTLAVTGDRYNSGLKTIKPDILQIFALFFSSSKQISRRYLSHAKTISLHIRCNILQQNCKTFSKI
jgi:hypothetical protein